MGFTVRKLEIENSPVKRRKIVRVVHKPCASFGYQFHGETLTLAERHYQDAVQYSDRARTAVLSSVSAGGYRVT